MAQASGITFKCPVCGGTELRVDLNDDNSVASCGACGSDFGRWGDIKANLGMDPDAGKTTDEAPKFNGLNQSWKFSR